MFGVEMCCCCWASFSRTLCAMKFIKNSLPRNAPTILVHVRLRPGIGSQASRDVFNTAVPAWMKPFTGKSRSIPLNVCLGDEKLAILTDFSEDR
jgi:hypothetical protein